MNSFIEHRKRGFCNFVLDIHYSDTGSLERLLGIRITCHTNIHATICLACGLQSSRKKLHKKTISSKMKFYFIACIQVTLIDPLYLSFLITDRHSVSALNTLSKCGDLNFDLHSYDTSEWGFNKNAKSIRLSKYSFQGSWIPRINLSFTASITPVSYNVIFLDIFECVIFKSLTSTWE